MSIVALFQPDGSEVLISEDELYARLNSIRSRPARPFSADRLDVVASVSNLLLERRKQYLPAISHFAFFTRHFALRKLASSFADRLPPSAHARARGLAFHLPPQNVETVFLYSWLLSYISGNANVVRLPRQISAEMRDILNMFMVAMEKSGDATQLFIHYPSDSGLGKGISALSDVRIVWGGDAKVETFAPLPLRKGGKSIWFGDRFSLCVMSGAAIAALDDAGLSDIAHHMFNDVFVFDQMACSSPQIIYVVGNKADHLSSLSRLLAKVSEVAGLKGQVPAAGHQIVKMVEAFSSAVREHSESIVWRDAHLTSTLVQATPRYEQRVGGGFLQTAFLQELNEITELIAEHDQTIAHFGFSTEEIKAAADLQVGFGASRWVPVGAALDFDAVWDGYDLPFEFTRIVRT